MVVSVKLNNMTLNEGIDYQWIPVFNSDVEYRTRPFEKIPITFLDVMQKIIYKPSESGFDGTLIITRFFDDTSNCLVDEFCFDNEQCDWKHTLSNVYTI